MKPTAQSSPSAATADIAGRVQVIRQRIESASRRAGRSSDEVTLMAVTKTQHPWKILAAYEAGLRCFGENRVQEYAAKVERLSDLEGATFALIGQLQSNKVNKAVELFSAIHSVDSLRLAQRVNAAVERAGRDPIPITIEINTGDPAKAGLVPDSPELEQLLASAELLQHIRIQGLMTLPPFSEDPEGARPYFRRLRHLKDMIVGRRFSGLEMKVLSMGMSHDFEVAIEEGSTCVRIGTAIFGERN
jgi:PLP dependent protein